MKRIRRWKLMRRVKARAWRPFGPVDGETGKRVLEICNPTRLTWKTRRGRP